MHILYKFSFYLPGYVCRKDTRVVQQVIILLPLLDLHDGLRTMVLYYCKTKTKQKNRNKPPIIPDVRLTERLNFVLQRLIFVCPQHVI